MTFPDIIQRFIVRHRLMRRDGFYLVALSGGADSVALLRALVELGYRVAAVHCNFRLRGAESDRDEIFCESLCQALGLTLHKAHFDTTAYAELHKISIEMAARDLRYGYFEQLAEAVGADGICVAHHRDDQVETVLLNLVRGTGLQGLQGMRPRNGRVLRPMLGVSRRQAQTYLDHLGQAFVVDSTNLETDAMRNKLRLQVLPLLEEINPAAKENVARMTENVREAGKVVKHAMRQAISAIRSDNGGYRLKALDELPSPIYALRTILEWRGFNRAQLLEMLAHRRDGATWMSNHWVAVMDRDYLFVVERKAWERPLPNLVIPERGTYRYPVGPLTALADGAEETAMRLRLELKNVDANFQIDPSATVANLDASLVKYPLVVRPLRKGDRFVPLGMKNSKLASDFLTDHKVPLLLRRRQLVVQDDRGDIVWLVGQRVDGRFAICPGKSREALIIQLL